MAATGRCGDRLRPSGHLSGVRRCTPRSPDTRKVLPRSRPVRAVLAPPEVVRRGHEERRVSSRNQALALRRFAMGLRPQETYGGSAMAEFEPLPVQVDRLRPVGSHHERIISSGLRAVLLEGSGR